MMLSKKEAVGIFASVAVMALVLVFFRFDLGSSNLFGGTKGNTQGAVVVVAGDNENQNAALSQAITEAATTKGELQKLVVDDVRLGTAGPAVKDGDTVTVNYEGRTKEGVKFDSSYDRGNPYTFTVGDGKVIEGWEKGIVGMKVGGQRILVIPPSMAYGNAQVGPIPPNSVLVFSIELVEIQ